MVKVFDPIKFGIQVAGWLRREKLSVREASARAGISPATVWRIAANGKRPSIKTYLALQAQLDKTNKARQIRAATAKQKRDRNRICL